MGDATDKIRWLWSGQMTEVILTRKDLREVLLQTGGAIVVNGRMRDLVSKHLGAGIYKVTTKAREYKKETP